jgi:hypothetical protein
MGHADAKTTMRYVHHTGQENEAEVLADAFRPIRAPTDNGAVAEPGTAA